MRQLLSKKNNKARNDVKGYYCPEICSLGCSDVCVVDCTGDCNTVCGDSCASKCTLYVINH